MVFVVASLLGRLKVCSSKRSKCTGSTEQNEGLQRLIESLGTPTQENIFPNAHARKTCTHLCVLPPASRGNWPVSRRRRLRSARLCIRRSSVPRISTGRLRRGCARCGCRTPCSRRRDLAHESFDVGLHADRLHPNDGVH